MTVSIIICTRNRADSLRETLASLAKAEIPSDYEVEVLVVDNGSTDHTPEVVREIRLPRLHLRYLLESQPGQCFARNAGLRAATGQVILFTDDDVRVSPRWIEGMTRPILTGTADAVAGGVIFPPAVEQAFRATLRTGSVVRRGWFASSEELDPVTPDRLIGANMAFGRHVLERVPEFETDLGPGALGFGDDTLFAWRLREEGFRLSSALQVTVEHHLDTTRLTPAALLTLAKKMGATTGYLDWHWKQVEVPLNSLRAAWLRVKTQLRRLISKRTESLPEWEFVYAMSLARREQFQRESQRPRKYRPSGASSPQQHTLGGAAVAQT